MVLMIGLTDGQLDGFLGRLFDAVERLKLDRNTYIVFASDNGWLLGEHRLTSKILAYDPSTRVPMAIAGPGLRPRTEAAIVLNLDIAPTLLDLAGLSIPKSMQGRSLAPLLKGGRENWRQSFVYEGLGSYGGTKPVLAAITSRWKLIHHWDDVASVTEKAPAFVELYDLGADPDETRNLVDAKSPDVVGIREKLAARIERHRILLRCQDAAETSE